MELSSGTANPSRMKHLSIRLPFTNHIHRPAGYITSKEGNKMQGKVWKETVAKLDAVKQGISQSL